MDENQHKKKLFWQSINGPLLTLAVLAALQTAPRLNIVIPNPAVIYLTAVVFAVFQGGIVPGFVSGAMTLLYAASFLSLPGQLFHYSSDNAARVMVLAVATPAMILMTGALKFRYDRMLSQQEKLVGDLQKALSEIKTLRGILPICSSCKRVRDDKGYWNLVETYVEAHSEAQFTHGFCPDCVRRLYPELLEGKPEQPF